MTPWPRNARHAARIVLAAMLVAGCGATTTGSSPAASAQAPTPTSVASEPAATPSPPQTTVASPSAVPLQGRILFARRDAAGDFNVFVINADGTGERRLVDGTHEIPRWSPDASRVSMTAELKGLLTTALVAIDGSGYRVLPTPAPGLSLGCSAWSPDGKRLACEGWDDANPARNGIYTVRTADGGDLVRVTSSPNGGHDIPGSYSPDGMQLSAVRSTEADHGALFLVAATGGEVRPLDAGDTFTSAFAPDGSSILVDGTASSLSRITVANGAVDAIKPAVGTPPLATFGGRWSPDGARIAWSMALAGSPSASIYTMATDGSDVRRLTSVAGQEEFADWAR